MSFGWSAGDIVAATILLVKVGKALREADGAASDYQETIYFLTSLDKTLTGLSTILQRNPGLQWEAEMIEQGNNLKGAIEAFDTKIKKYDLSLNAASERKTARKVPREIQYALSSEVKEFKGKVVQAQMLLDNSILLQNLTTILDISKSSTTLLEDSAARAEEVEDKRESLEVSQTRYSTQLETLSSAIQTHLAQLATIQDSSTEQQMLRQEEFKAWQLKLQLLIGNFLQSAQMQHDRLIEEIKASSTPKTMTGLARIGQLGAGMIHVVATGLASWAGAILTSYQQSVPSEDRSPRSVSSESLSTKRRKINRAPAARLRGRDRSFTTHSSDPFSSKYVSSQSKREYDTGSQMVNYDISSTMGRREPRKSASTAPSTFRSAPDWRQCCQCRNSFQLQHSEHGGYCKICWDNRRDCEYYEENPYLDPSGPRTNLDKSSGYYAAPGTIFSSVLLKYESDYARSAYPGNDYERPDRS